MTNEEKESTHDWTMLLLPSAGAPEDRSKGVTLMACRQCGAIKITQGDAEVNRPCPWYVAEEPDA